MAALWKLPVIYIVENNRFGMGTAWERASSLYDISQKAQRVRHARRRCDGMDVLDDARDDARGRRARAQGRGPHAHRSAQLPLHGPLDVGSRVAACTARRKKSSRHKQQRSDPHASSSSCVGNGRADRTRSSRRWTQRCTHEVDDAAEFADESPEPGARRALHRRLLPRRTSTAACSSTTKNRLEQLIMADDHVPRGARTRR